MESKEQVKQPQETQSKKEERGDESATIHESKEIDKALQSCEQEKKQWKERYVKVAADLENFRRRVEKDQQSWARAAQAKLLNDLLPVIDDLERAQEAIKNVEKNDEWVQGFSFIYDAWHKVLAMYGVQEVDCIGAFNPEYHEAILQVDSPDHKAGDIVYIIRKGYLFGDQILRPAQVSVAK